MALIRKSIWTKSNTLPVSNIKTPFLSFNFSGWYTALSLFILPAVYGAIRIDSSISNFFFRLTDVSSNEIPITLNIHRKVDIAQPIKYEYNSLTGEFNIVVYTSNLSIVSLLDEIILQLNNIPKLRTEIITTTGETLYLERGADLSKGNGVVDVDFIHNNVSIPFSTNILNDGKVVITGSQFAYKNPQSLTYDPDYIENPDNPNFFQGGSWNAETKTLTAFDPFSISIPEDTVDSNGNITNIESLLEVYSVFEDSVDHSSLVWTGPAYKSAEIFTDEFKAQVKLLIVPPVIDGVTVTQQSLQDRSQLIDIKFDRDDGSSIDGQFTVPKALVDVTDFNLAITEEAIDISVITDQTVIDITPPPSQTIDLTTTSTDINFNTNDITNVDLTVQELPITIIEEALQVDFQNQGTQGTPGSGFVTVFIRSQNVPPTPLGGSYNFGTNTLTPPGGWFTFPPTGLGDLYMSFSTLIINTDFNWSNPIPTTSSRDGGGGTTIFRIAEPLENIPGIIWVKRLSYSQNLLVGNLNDSAWIELIPGIGDVELNANGTQEQRNNYLIFDANSETDDARQLLDFVDANIGRT